MQPTTMAGREQLARRLHALITHVHATANRDLINEMDRQGLNTQRIRLLQHLASVKEPPTIHECAAVVHIASNTASGLMAEMRDRGLLTVTPDEMDVRRKHVSITDAGRESLIRLHAARQPAVQAFIDQLTERQADALEHAIQEIFDATVAGD